MIESISPAVGARAAESARVSERVEAPRGQGGDRLMDAAVQLEGVFIQQLMKALRSTIPSQGNPDAPGADLYSSLLDEHLADMVATDSRTGLADALYRQLTVGHNDGPREGSES